MQLMGTLGRLRTILVQVGEATLALNVSYTFCVALYPPTDNTTWLELSGSTASSVIALNAGRLPVMVVVLHTAPLRLKRFTEAPSVA